jgi:hypothetical protein
MFPLINVVQDAISNKKERFFKDIANEGDLASLNRIFTDGIPKMTLCQKFLQKRNQFAATFNRPYLQTKHSQDKEIIANHLSRDIYDALKVQGYIKNKSNFSCLEFVKLKKRCNKIRSPEILWGTLTEIIHQHRKGLFLKEEQLEALLSSSSDLKRIMNKGIKAKEWQDIKLKDGIEPLEKQLFILQILYDGNCKHNVTSEKLDKMDEEQCKKLFSVISEGTIRNCLNKRKLFEKSLFAENLSEEAIESFKEEILKHIKKNP